MPPRAVARGQLEQVFFCPLADGKNPPRPKADTKAKTALRPEQELLLPGSFQLKDCGAGRKGPAVNTRTLSMKSYRMIAFSFVAALALTGVNALAQTMNAPRGTLARAHQNFLDDAVQGDLSEINIGKLAQQKGQSENVKNFGQILEQTRSAADGGDAAIRAECKTKENVRSPEQPVGPPIRPAVCAGDGQRSQRRHRQISERSKI